MMLLPLVFLGLRVHAQTTDCPSGWILLTVASPRELGKSPVLSLSPDDLRIQAAGKDVSIISVVHPSHPSRVAVILDIGSGQSKSTWDMAALIVRSLPSQFPDDAQFSLVLFDDKVQQVVPLQAGPHALDGPIARTSPSKNRETETALYDALDAGIRTLDTPQPGDVEFLVTAWEGGHDRERQSTAMRLLSGGGVRLIGLSFDQSVLPGPLPPGFHVTSQSFSAISAVSAASSGVWFRSSGSAPPPDLFVPDLAGLVSDAYIVTLRMPRSMTKPEALTVEMSKGSRAHVRQKLSPKDIKLSYPRMLVPCH